MSLTRKSHWDSACVSAVMDWCHCRGVHCLVHSLDIKNVFCAPLLATPLVSPFRKFALCLSLTIDDNVGLQQEGNHGTPNSAPVVRSDEKSSSVVGQMDNARPLHPA